MSKPTTTAARTRRLGRMVLAALVGAVGVFVLAATPDAPAVAQGDPVAQPGDAADWVPFRGAYAVGCTRANPDNPGCEVHHPTWAIDVAIPAGDPIRSAGHGVVVGVYRGCAPLGGDGECNGGAGNIVVVSHGDYSSRYLHLSSIPTRIRPGLRVEPGTVVGRSGASGTFGGVHLHYDEYQVGSPAGRVAFGRMLACHDDTAVVYPDVLGYTEWDEVPPGLTIRNDGYDCTGHPTLPHPPPPEPPVYPVAPPLGVSGTGSMAVGDLDGDGRDEVVIGVPGANPSQARRAGMVVTVPATQRRGARTLVSEAGLPGLREGGDLMGAAVAVGDWDCDGRDDVAIGAPGEDLQEPFTDAGAVAVVFGDGGEQLFFSGQGLDGYYLRPGDWLGAALATGDFDGDGCDDLAIASPGADRSGGLDMGLVWVLRGSPSGLVSPVKLLQGIGLPGLLENHDRTGTALAAGDFDCDGVDDLAVGAAFETVSAPGDGAVLIARGGSGGLRAAHVLYPGGGFAGTAGAGDHVGLTLAAGDVDRDGCDDLAAGAPGTDVGGRTDAGRVLLTFGHPDGLIASTRQRSFVIGGTIPGDPRRGDQLGIGLTMVDLDCDRRDELAIGAPGRDVRGRRNAGAVFVLDTNRRGAVVDVRMLRQGAGFNGRLAPGARVGSGLAAGDANGDRCDDLLAAAPGTRVVGRAGAGAVHVAWGASGRAAVRPVRLDQRPPMPGPPVPRASFGGGSPAVLFGIELQG